MKFYMSAYELLVHELTIAQEMGGKWIVMTENAVISRSSFSLGSFFKRDERVFFYDNRNKKSSKTLNIDEVLQVLSNLKKQNPDVRSFLTKDVHAGDYIVDLMSIIELWECRNNLTFWYEARNVFLFDNTFIEPNWVEFFDGKMLRYLKQLSFTTGGIKIARQWLREHPCAVEGLPDRIRALPGERLPITFLEVRIRTAGIIG